MPVLHFHPQFLAEVVLKNAGVEVANLCALPLVPKILIVIGESEVWIRVSVKLDGDIAVECLTFAALEAGVAAAACFGFGILLAHGIADGQPGEEGDIGVEVEVVISCAIAAGGEALPPNFAGTALKVFVLAGVAAAEFDEGAEGDGHIPAARPTGTNERVPEVDFVYPNLAADFTPGVVPDAEQDAADVFDGELCASSASHGEAIGVPVGCIGGRRGRWHFVNQRRSRIQGHIPLSGQSGLGKSISACNIRRGVSALISKIYLNEPPSLKVNWDGVFVVVGEVFKNVDVLIFLLWVNERIGVVKRAAVAGPHARGELQHEGGIAFVTVQPEAKGVMFAKVLSLALC